MFLSNAGFLGAQHIGSGATTSTERSIQEVNASTVMLPCTPVAAYWSGSPPSAGMPPGPNLAVVSINVRPKDARVHLDGRFVGRARYLDGKPGYLYLEPGTYALELRLEGHAPVLVELDAKAACRYDLKHRLESSKRQTTGESEKDFGKGKPFDRVYQPLLKVDPAEKPSRQAGPDTSLRGDLDGGKASDGGPARKKGAALRLLVTPDTASVSIDGAFVATARELRSMEGPLATTPGKHQVVVRAPGLGEVSRDIELSEGEVLELEFALSEDRTK
jgi:hypothetical protein